MQRNLCLEEEERTLTRPLLGEIAWAHPWQATSKADSPAILVARRLKSLTNTNQPYSPGRFIVRRLALVENAKSSFVANY